MTTIFICGKQSDHSLSRVLPQALSAYGGVQYFNGKELLRLGQSPLHFLIYEWESLPYPPCTKGILFFKNSFYPQQDCVLPESLLPVFESRNAVLASFLSASQTSAVTCGTCAHDALSLSSLSDQSAMVSLQKSVATLAGQLLEPGDIPVLLRRRHSPHQILAVVSILLLSGVPWDEGYLF